MNTIKIWATLLLVIFSLTCFGQTNKAVLVILDGIPADVLEKTQTPAIDDIIKNGAYTHAYIGGEVATYSESPTISAVGYNHVITGTWSHKHNVYDNKIDNPNYNYWNIFRIAETSDKALKTAIFSTWLDNRTKLIGENLEKAGNIQLDYKFDGFELDTVAFPHSNKEYIHRIDEHVSKEAGRYIEAEGPDLSWVYLQFTDDIGHYKGDSPEMTQAVEKADAQVARIWKAVQAREKSFNENWMIIITTDHGRSEKDGKGHGGQSARERKIWIATNKPNMNQRFKQTPAAVDIMPTIARHLNLNVPEAVMQEADGVPLIGKVSISNLKGHTVGNKLNLQWDALDSEGIVEVLISTTNNYKTGSKDKYVSLGTAKVKDKKATLKMPNVNSQFYKILVKAPHNTVNMWVVK